MSDRIVRSLSVVSVCAGAWLLLHGEVTVANVLWGVVLGVGLAVVFPIDTSARRHRLHPWALVKLLVFVLKELVVSSWMVIKLIIRPTPAALRAGVVRIALEHDSPLTTTIVANLSKYAGPSRRRRLIDRLRPSAATTTPYKHRK